MSKVLLNNLKGNPKRIQQLMDNAYLGLGDTSNMVLMNPLLDKSQFDIENPHVHLLRLMRNPDYFWFTCKWLFNIDLLPFQLVILKELWTRKFPMLVASRGGSKTWILSLYAILKALFDQGSKIVVVGAAFRQSKILFEYMETFWRDAPIVRHIVGSGKHQGPKRDVDRCNFYVGRSVISCIPLGDGSKIRGLRSNITIADEFACLDKDSIVETVNGFVRISDFGRLDNHLITGDDKHLTEFPTKFIKTPLCDVYEVKFRNGYIIKCSENHKVMTNKGWKKPLSLEAGDFVEKSEQSKVNFSRNNIPGLDNKTAWLLGTLVSEGAVNHPAQIQVTTTDK